MDEPFNPGGADRSLTVKIAAGQDTSEIVNLDRYRFMGLQFPDTMTGTVLTIVAGAGVDRSDTLANAIAALEGGELRQVYGDDGNLISVQVVVDNCVGVSAQTMGKLAAFRYIALRSNQAEEADRLIGVAFK